MVRTDNGDGACEFQLCISLLDTLQCLRPKNSGRVEMSSCIQTYPKITVSFTSGFTSKTLMMLVNLDNDNLRDIVSRSQIMNFTKLPIK